jgi:putative ABC transport system substrate-binding protein
VTDVRRREFITLLGGAAAAWPLAARAQQPAMPVIGFLNIASPDGFAPRLRAFRQGLKEAGYIEGENVAIDYRWAENQGERLPAFAADLVRRQVSVIAASGGSLPAVAAKAATKTIPIVFGIPEDPVRIGLVESLARPGGNATGINFFTAELVAKRLGLLRELLPGAARVAVLVNLDNAALLRSTVQELEEAASAVGLKVRVLPASNGREINSAFVNLMRERPDALFIGPGPLFVDRRIQLANLAARYVIPTVFAVRDNVEAGGLMSYGTDVNEAYRQIGAYTGRVLKGAGGFAGHAINQVRARHQHANGKVARPRRAVHVARPRRRGDRVRRREFITLLGGTAAAASAVWPFSAHAQQAKVARIGFLGLVSPSSHAPRVAALRAGLRDLGWIEGRNILIEFRWADGNYERLPALAEELVRLNVDVLVTHGAAGALAAKNATSTVPIVITAVGDMLALGLVSSLARPGGNITGSSLFVAEHTAKRLELIKEAVPSLTRVAVLLNPANASTQIVLSETEATAKASNVELRAFEARQPSDFDAFLRRWLISISARL